MENRVIVLLLSFSLFVGSDVINFENNSTSKNVITEIEMNQELGIDCSIYSNSIEVFIIEYKQMYNSLNIGCQLHLKSTAEKLKSTIDEMVGKKLKAYLTTVNQMRSKIIEIIKYQEQSELLEVNSTGDIIDKNNLNAHIEKYKIDLKSANENLTSTINEKKILAEQILQLETNLTENIKKSDNVLNFVYNQTVQCQEDLKSLERNLTAKAKENYNNAFYVAGFVQNGDFVLGRELFSNSSELDRDLLIAYIYNKNISNVHIIIEFLNSFINDETIIHGYRLLIDQMKKNQHTYSTPTTTIAYRVFVDFNLKYENDKNLIYLKANLPQSLKNLLWNQLIVIVNINFDRDIWICNRCTNLHHDNLRIIPVIYPTSTTDNDLAHYFYPISNGKYFHIKSRRENQYLYADTNEFALDNDRRAVFGYRKVNEVTEMGGWQLEPIEGSYDFKIKNVYWNEYLSVAEGISAGTYLKLFTLKSGKCEDNNCKWNFLKYTG